MNCTIAFFVFLFVITLALKEKCPDMLKKGGATSRHRAGLTRVIRQATNCCPVCDPGTINFTNPNPDTAQDVKKINLVNSSLQCTFLRLKCPIGDMYCIEYADGSSDCTNIQLPTTMFDIYCNSDQQWYEINSGELVTAFYCNTPTMGSTKPPCTSACTKCSETLTASNNLVQGSALGNYSFTYSVDSSGCSEAIMTCSLYPNQTGGLEGIYVDDYSGNQYQIGGVGTSQTAIFVCDSNSDWSYTNAGSTITGLNGFQCAVALTTTTPIPCPGATTTTTTTTSQPCIQPCTTCSQNLMAGDSLVVGSSLGQYSFTYTTTSNGCESAIMICSLSSSQSGTAGIYVNDMGGTQYQIGGLGTSQTVTFICNNSGQWTYTLNSITITINTNTIQCAVALATTTPTIAPCQPSTTTTTTTAAPTPSPCTPPTTTTTTTTTTSAPCVPSTTTPKPTTSMPCTPPTTIPTTTTTTSAPCTPPTTPPTTTPTTSSPCIQPTTTPTIATTSQPCSPSTSTTPSTPCNPCDSCPDLTASNNKVFNSKLGNFVFTYDASCTGCRTSELSCSVPSSLTGIAGIYVDDIADNNQYQIGVISSSGTSVAFECNTDGQWTYTFDNTQIIIDNMSIQCAIA